MAHDSRGYKMLEELGTLPRVTYLKGGSTHAGNVKASSGPRLVPKNPRIPQNIFCWITSTRGNERHGDGIDAHTSWKFWTVTMFLILTVLVCLVTAWVT